ARANRRQCEHPTVPTYVPGAHALLRPTHVGLHAPRPASSPQADAIAFRLEIPQLVLRGAADAYAYAHGRDEVRRLRAWVKALARSASNSSASLQNGISGRISIRPQRRGLCSLRHATFRLRLVLRWPQLQSQARLFLGAMSG